MIILSASAYPVSTAPCAVLKKCGWQASPANKILGTNLKSLIGLAKYLGAVLKTSVVKLKNEYDPTLFGAEKNLVVSILIGVV